MEPTTLKAQAYDLIRRLDMLNLEAEAIRGELAKTNELIRAAEAGKATPDGD